MTKSNETAEHIIDMGAASIETKGGQDVADFDNLLGSKRPIGAGLSND